VIPASAYLSPSANPQISREQEQEFYWRIKTSNGTMKSTQPRRLDAMNDLFFTTLKRLGLAPRVAMDIGISSGITTMEWLQDFDRHGLPVTMIATDFVMNVYLYGIGRHVRVLAEHNGHLLQIEMFGHGIRTYVSRRDYLTGAVLWRSALRTVARLLLKKARPQGPYQFVSPVLRGQDRIRLCDDDILAPSPSEFIRCADVVRVANLVQPIYFSDAEIRRAVSNIRERCRGEGSLVIVCRSQEASFDGSILRMVEGRRFVTEARLGKGSEVEGYFTAEL
jgi:hypothetical protein